MTPPSIVTLTDYLHASQAFSNFNNPDHGNYALRKGPQHQVCAALGLAGEVSEALEAFDALRDRFSAFDNGSLKTKFSKELGDVVWYIAQACDAHSIDITFLQSSVAAITAIERDMERMVIDAGKHADYMKKCVYHGHEVDPAVVSGHLTAVLTKVKAVCTKVGFNFWSVLSENIAKLEARYPEGKFTVERSVHRAVEA